MVIPYYRYRQDIVDNCRKAAEGIDMGRYSYLRPLIVASMGGIYSNGVVRDVNYGEVLAIHLRRVPHLQTARLEKSGHNGKHGYSKKYK